MSVVASPTGPLQGIRVLDLTSVIMGPFATQILGDLGADVIAVEDLEGDTNRVMGAGPHPQVSGVSLNLLRNKRNISLDLKQPDGREAFLRLAETSDIVITNLRPAPLGRLRLTYSDVAARNANVIFCTAQGWPSDSDRANAPAYDDIIQAATGVADVLQRTNGQPMLMPSIIADKVSGLTITYAVLAALHHRDRTGEGQHVEIPMVEAMKAFMLVEHGAGAIPVPPLARAGYSRILTPNRKPQPTTDGFINVLPYNRSHYDDLFSTGGRPDLVDDERVRDGRSRIANADSLYVDIAAVISTNTTAFWMAFCDEHGIPASTVITLDELVADLPVVEHPDLGLYHQTPMPARFSRTPSNLRRHAPTIGEHTNEVLSEVGYTAAELDHLRTSGATPADQAVR